MIVVSGYYGFDNLGDEAILDALCSDLEAVGYERKNVCVLSASPIQTVATHRVQSISRYDLFEIWRVLSSADCFISGGGSLLQDVTSRRSIPYYLFLVELALLRKIPVIMYAQGVGPIKNSLYRAWVRRAYERSAICSVRDQESAAFLHELGVSPTNLKITVDPVFQRLKGPSLRDDQKRVLLNIRPYKGWNKQQNYWTNLIEQWHKDNLSVEFVSLGPGDEEIGKALQSVCTHLLVHSTLTLDNFNKVFSGAHLCVSMRLHGIIFSALNQVLTIGLNYDPKVKAIGKQLNIPIWELHSLQGLDRFIEQVLNKRNYHERNLIEAVENLYHISVLNRHLLAQVLKG